MIVVSNSSPLVSLARIGWLNLLASLYKRILIPIGVQHEVIVAGRGLPGAEEVRTASWIEVASQNAQQDPSLAQACRNLGAGECGAILSILDSFKTASRVLAYQSCKHYLRIEHRHNNES